MTAVIEDDKTSTSSITRISVFPFWGMRIPGKSSTQTGFGVLSYYPTSPPTGLLGVGLGGDNSPRMIAFEARLEY